MGQILIQDVKTALEKMKNEKASGNRMCQWNRGRRRGMDFACIGNPLEYRKNAG